MAAGRLDSILGYLRTLTARSAGDDASDRALLERFAGQRDEAAFESLVQRHGSMVFNVCRRVLGDDHAAEDAFQAAFIVLARKASSLWGQDTVAGWLYTVAYHAALKARSAEQRRRQHERQVQPVASSPPSDELAWRDLGPVLDEEIQRLPERLRTPFVLCCLQAKTNEEAARLLGCPTGTVLSRLSRARERLRDRLTRRGVTLSATALGTLVAQQANAFAPPPALVRRTLEVALPASMGPVAACQAAVIATGVLRTMKIAKLTQAALLAAVLCGVGGLIAYRHATAFVPDVEPVKVAPPKEAEVKKASDAIKAAIGADFKSATLIDDQPVLRVFPGWLFFDVRFTYNYGVPLGNIEGSSCWAVDKASGKATRLGNLGQVNVPELSKFFEKNLPVMLFDEPALKDAAFACLRISQEAFTDHRWIEIKLQEASIKAAAKHPTWQASGKLVVTPKGGNGGDLTLTITLEGKMGPSVDIVSTIRHGPRPICQATKLLDDDPVIRAMAEQQLLLIGRNARDYLIERRAEATSEELRAAIDRLWQRILEEEKQSVERVLVRPDERLLQHPERIVREMARQQMRLLR